MPYVKPIDRKRFACLFVPETPGDINYAITVLLNIYLERKNVSYQTINDIVGALEGAKQEFYRRVAVPYEEAKLTTNGDVYGR